jgi:predicted dehydrogenase/threonine dehydrogenase-like Zn-dependent dehydrogenase
VKQVVQNLRSGVIELAEVPPPSLRAPGVLVATACSVLSPGTERAAVELGKSSLLGKALRRPDQVRKVLDNLRREGVWPTVHKVRQRLEVTRAMGYSCAGVVLESRESALRPGDRVACAGTDAATHAEINFVPRNLCVAIPLGVKFEEAAFAALGGIALHAARLGEAALGEDVAVVGLGLVGLLLAQVLRAAGCRVAGFDPRADRLQLARSLGFERVAAPRRETLEDTLGAWRIRGGFDRVFITAASSSAEPVEFAVEAARDRAVVIVVGDVRTDFPRGACYTKELRVYYARSYGPGRYDPEYEERGADYPRAYVPWTLGRNLGAFLDLVASGAVNISPLVTHRLPIAEASRAYDIVSGKEASLGVVLEYPLAETTPAATISLRPFTPKQVGTLGVAFLGAGSYACGTLLPALREHADIRMVSVATSRGLSARKVADQFGFARCSTNSAEVLADPDVDLVFIAARHDVHAALAQAALEAGKAVFVEKPLCLNEEELESLVRAHRQNPRPFLVGHNRRFAPATRAVSEFFAAGRGAAPLSIRYAVHAGPLPAGHWLRDPAHGGRILGEACHFVDWCLHLAGAPLSKLYAVTRGVTGEETMHAVLDFADGSTASISYETSSHTSRPKEVVEISQAGRTAILEDFARVEFLSSAGRTSQSFQGKGQKEMIAAFLEDVKKGQMRIPFSSWVSSARATLGLLESSTTGLPAFLDSIS